ncbi:IS110 family transposase [bacterium]|nr:IS110 family transposase [bacterium]
MLSNHQYILTCDIGKEVSIAFLGKKDGTCLKDCWKFSHCLKDYQKLIRGLNPKETLVGFEATGHYWFSLYEFLVKKGFEVTVLNPLQVKSFRDSGIRGSKTDKLDAKLIFNLLLYSGKPLALERYPEKIIELRNLCRLRHKLSQQKTLLTNKLISILDIIFPEYQRVLSPKRLASLNLLKRYPLPDKIAALPLPKLTQILNKGCKGKGSPEKWAKGLKEKANQTIGSKLGLNTFSLEIKIIIQRINQTAKQIKLLDKEIKKIFSQFSESKLLLTIPGINDILGATILAEIGDINRFRAKNGADKIVALAGLDGKVKESGKGAGKTKMSKRGSTDLRWALWQAATVALRCDPSLKEVYLKQKAKHKHYYVCVSYVAKKLARIVYSVLMNKSSYQPFHSVTRH